MFVDEKPCRRQALLRPAFLATAVKTSVLPACVNFSGIFGCNISDYLDLDAA